MKGNIGNLMKQAQAMQENMAKAQAEIVNIEVIGESGGGMVKITMNGRHEVKRVQIEPAVVSEDREMLERLRPCSLRCVDHEQEEIHAGRSGDHRADEALVPRDVDDGE